MNFGSHLDATVTLAVALVNALTQGWDRGHERGRPATDEARERLVEALSERRNRARDARGAPDTTIDRVVDVAQTLREVFEAAAAGELDRAARALNATLREVQAHPELSQHDGQPWHVHFHAASADLADGLAASCATALAMVVGRGSGGRLGVCAAEACDRVYVDTSRNASRRFCSTACQNRTKAAAFRARQGSS